MSIKKFLIIAIVLSLLTVGAVSAASIADQTTDLLEKNGYKVNTHQEDTLDDGTEVTSYTYNKGQYTVLILYMYDYTISMDDLEDGFSEKTINNTKGFYRQDSGKTLFHYPCGDDSVMIKTNDPNILSKIVLGN